MKKLFIHHPLFRILSPVFNGIIVYLLILLIGNDVEQLQDHFLGEELYICIGLSYLIQESIRAFLLIFQHLFKNTSLASFIVQIIISILLCIGLTTLSINLYFEFSLGFSPTHNQLWLFNIIFICLTLIYVLLHISHLYLYKINSKKLENEIALKIMIEDDFSQFKKGINTELLFESLESLILLMKENKEKSDDLIDQLAIVYRYILSRKEKQLVDIKEEHEVLVSLVNLLNSLPYRKVIIKTSIQSNFMVVPGSLLSIIEQIIRCTIKSSSNELLIHINERDDALQIQYQFNDKIMNEFTLDYLKDIQRIYKIYSETDIAVLELEQHRTISIPKLIITNTL